MLTTVLIVLHVLVALAIIVLVLLQHGKGADMGTGFGAGASGSLFGATGSANFLSRTTGILAAAYFATNRPKAVGGVMQNLPAQTAPAPGAPADPAAVKIDPATPAPAADKAA